MEGIQIAVNRIGTRGDIALLKVKGYVDTSTSSELFQVLSKILGDGIAQLIVDLGAVNYVSSAGWGVFVGEIRGIREKGGDLKIVHMTPDVYEVFEMLEFNRILAYYECIEEAMNDFEIAMGLDITKSIERRPVTISKEQMADGFVRQLSSRAQVTTTQGLRSRPTFVKPKVDESSLPLVEKIKLLIIENPNNGARQIQKALLSARFGYTKVSWFKVRNILKKYNLETKEKRYRFYRSR